MVVGKRCLMGITVVLFAALCVSCGVPKYSTVTPELQNQFMEDLKAGNENLTCESIECAFSWTEHFSQMVSLFNSKQWQRLAELVMQVGYTRDLSYFYLGASAEGLNYKNAAIKYYQKALALYKDPVRLHHCREFKQGCGGLDLGLVLPQQIASLQVDMNPRRLQNQKQSESPPRELSRFSGILPIKNGTYVAEGDKCPEPSETLGSESLSYRSEADTDRKGKPIKGKYRAYFSQNENVYHCPIVKQTKNGNIYKLELYCMTGVGAHEIGTENWTVRVMDDTSFALMHNQQERKSTGKKETVYRYCFEE